MLFFITFEFMELKDKIKLLLSYESTKRIWKNEHNSAEWILANEVSSLVMSQGLNRVRNCGCLNDLFIMLKTLTEKRIELKQLQMENDFKLKDGIVLFYNGTAYGTANITDEKSIELLTKFPIKINAFISYPKNWKELIKGTKKESAKPIEGADEFKDLSDQDLRELCNKLAEHTEGLKKLHHASGTEKMIEYLLKNKVNG